MGTSERRRREQSRMRNKILNAARTLFVGHGYEAVTMREIARKIEYSPTAIYAHFADKETLVRELCTADFQALARAVGLIARVPDPVTRLRRMGHAYAEFGLRNPNHYRLMFMTPHPALEPDPADIEKDNPEQDGYALLESTVVAGVKAKRFRTRVTDAALIAQTVWAGIHGAVSLEIAKSHDPWVDWRPAKKRIDFMIDVLIKGLTKEHPVTSRTPKTGKQQKKINK